MDWSGFAVYALPWMPASARLVGRAREMTNMLGCYLRVVTDNPAAAAAHGADEVLTAAVASADRLAAWTRTAAPEVWLFPDNRAVAPVAGRLAGLLGAPIQEGLVSVDLDLNDRSLLMRLETFGGRQLEEWAAIPEARPQIVLVRTDRLADPIPEAREPEVSALP
ncbi:MAG: hypothetical protein HYY18_17380 [Planctomycetes bacterium]|nr:hypothetical protein [Planctomycetota bacterium]